MATKEDVFKKLGAPAAASPSTRPSRADVFKKLETANQPPEASPYDTWGGTLSQIGKILGSSFLQAETGIAGIPANTAELYNSGLEQLPDSVRPFADSAVKVLTPGYALSQGLRAAGWPTTEEMNKNITDAGMMNNPEKGSGEDWAQYLLSNAMTAAVPVGQEATLANAGKGVLSSLLPAAAGKGVADFTDSPTTGIIASILTGVGQHGVSSMLNPTAEVSKQLGSDLGPSGVDDMREYNRLGVPAMAADVIPETSQSATATRNAVAHYPEAASDFVTALIDRSKNAATRIQNYFNEGAGVPDTADAHLGNIARETDAVVKPVHDDVRTSDLTINVNKVLKDVIPYTKHQSVKPTPLQATMNTVKNHLLKKGEGGMLVPNNQVQAAFAAREYIEKQITAHPELESALKPIYKKLNGLIAGPTGPHPELIDADNAKAFATVRQNAVEAGRKAASSGAAEDVAATYAKLGEHPKGEILQQDFKIGYGDKIKTNVQNTPVSGSSATPMNAAGQGSELSAIYGPEMAQRRDFEIKANETKGKYVVAPDSREGFIERLRHTPGYGFGAVTGLASALGAVAMGHNALAGLSTAGALTSGAIGIAKILREPKLAKAWVKAAGLKNVDELEKFLLKGKEHGTYGGSAARAGLINAITNYGR